MTDRRPEDCFWDGNGVHFYQQTFKAMGTSCDIQLFAATRAKAKRVAAKAIADVRRLEGRYTRYREDSFLSEINRVAAVGGSIKVDDETSGLLNYAATCYEQSDGLFDITSGILRDAWNFKGDTLPDKQHVQRLLDKIGWHRLRWAPPALEFPIPGMEIDFGGVVKEYAVDRAAAMCRNAGVEHGLLNLGGDITIIGPRPDREPWRIGIRHPNSDKDLVNTLQIHEGALASSGDYARCITLNGIRYGHILNPKTGWPVRSLASVTVVGDLCVVAGSSSTIAILKEVEGPAWLDDLGLPHLWIDVNGNCGGSLAHSAGIGRSVTRADRTENAPAVVLND